LINRLFFCLRRAAERFDGSVLRMALACSIAPRCGTRQAQHRCVTSSPAQRPSAAGAWRARRAAVSRLAPRRCVLTCTRTHAAALRLLRTLRTSRVYLFTHLPGAQTERSVQALSSFHVWSQYPFHYNASSASAVPARALRISRDGCGRRGGIEAGRKHAWW